MENNGMNNMQGHNHENGQHCGACCGMGGGMWNRRHMGHVLIKIVVALFIFWAGVQFGELKAMLHSGVYGNAGYDTRGVMMGGWSY